MLGLEPMAGQSLANKILDKAISGDFEVVVYGDPDIDGLFAAKFYLDFLKQHGIAAKTVINPNRTHGYLKPVDAFQGKILLSGDFKVTPETFKDVVDSGCTWLCTDHHSEDRAEFDSGFLEYSGSVMMNPSYGNQPLEYRFLSGAGVVLDVLSQYDPSFLTMERKAQVGLTLLSDVCPIDGNPHARELLTLLYNQPYSGYFKSLVDGVYKYSKDYGFGVPELSRNFIDYKLNPLINSMLRLGATDDALRFVCDGVAPPHNYIQTQKQLVAQAGDWCKELVHNGVTFRSYSLDKCVPQFKKVMGNFIGYLANKTGNCCLSMLYSKDLGFIRASFRGRYNLDYRRAVDGILGVSAVGHPTAFGVILPNGEVPSGYFDEFSRRIARLEEQVSKSDESVVVEVSDLAAWLSDGGTKVAKENDFTHRGKTYLKYTGAQFTLDSHSPKFKRWRLPGNVYVLGLHGEGSPKDGLIQPVYDRRDVVFIMKGN